MPGLLHEKYRRNSKVFESLASTKRKLGNPMHQDPKISKLKFPSDADHRSRVERAQAAMKKAGIDVLAISGFDYLRFFTGLNGLPIGRPIWLIILRQGSPTFVAPRSEAKEIRARCATPVAAEWVEWEEPIPAPMSHQDALAKYIAEIAPDAQTIGVDFNSTWASNIELVKQVLGAERIKDATSMLRTLLAFKNAVVIDGIRRATSIVAHQYVAAREAIAPGVPEWEVTLASVTAAIKRSAELLNEDVEQPRFWPHQMNMVASGPERTARCHCSGGGRIMNDGENVQICLCGQVFAGYGVCFDRPIAVGSKPLAVELRRVIDAARKAQEAALATIRPGVAAGDVHAAAVEVIERGGWQSPFLHRTGRGIGYSDWDGIELKADSSVELEAGMVLSVEPGIYVDGVGGARFGDTVLVTETGYEVLTPFELGRDI
ncbi:aminopeptidase P family protein [Rhizobium rhizogenes]|uniref:M24 family metallopeptidase n=2 Tax=Rhizobium/Agrobacterium group TaxID=227290 RepID=UPI0009BFA726|nr:MULTISPECIES: Xaa-Pro peptidase family protein [Rhizobium/Agrobacterium group]TRB23438.1 aminopeptidase P family protein [Agrobacterium fabrum]TRB53439.1 aminopeptidase P family protein [Rhizobium rhizogenes]